MKVKTALIPEKMIRKATEKCQEPVPPHNFPKEKYHCIIKVEKDIFPLKELASMYTALDVAKYIVVKCMKDEHPITNLQLQKILFYIQREYLFVTDQPLFKDSFEAWKFGPVVPKVY